MGAGNRVAEERMRLGMSQQELATQVTRLGYPITQTGIDKIEKRDTARPKCLKELAVALRVTQEWLLTGIEPRTQSPDFLLEEIRRDMRQLEVAERDVLFLQFRSLLDIALKKDVKRLK